MDLLAFYNMENPRSFEELTKADKALFHSSAKFINALHPRVADMGCLNPKSAYIGIFFSVNIEQIDADFNFWTPPQGYRNAFDFVLCLEVLEHLQNPLLFMQGIKEILKPGGVIYLSTLAFPRFLWTEYHFFEMSKKHLTKWIFSPLELKIVDYKRLRIGQPWYFYFSGARPFLRIFFNHIFIYKLTKK